MRKMLGVGACGLVIVATAGCGGTSNDTVVTAQTKTPTTTEAGSSATASIAAPPIVANSADQATVDASVLKLSDFPSGWTGKPDDDLGDAETLEFGGYKELRNKAVGTAKSPTFDQEDSSSLSQIVLIWPTEAEAREVMNLFSQQDFVDCVGDTFKDNLQKAYDEQGEGLKLGDVEVSMLRVEDHGDASAGIRAATGVGQGSIDVDVTVDVNAVQVGRAVSLITAIGAFSPVSETDRLSGIAAERLLTALSR